MARKAYIFMPLIYKHKEMVILSSPRPSLVHMTTHCVHDNEFIRKKKVLKVKANT